MLHCPNHRDKTPSLSVRDTQDRLLIFDFGGCRTEDVMKAAGLRKRDLFSGRPPTVEQLRAAAVQSQRERAKGRALGDAAAEIWRLEVTLNHLGEMLAREPDDSIGDSLNDQFNEVCNALHIAELSWNRLRAATAANVAKSKGYTPKP
jgi:hypothetical protein